jgi:glycosyltransferase involved in cell wall biosynthesis
MRIALVGTRGIPARYGGFETFAEELATRLAARGHQVSVYCRRRHSSDHYRGVRLIYLPAVRHKYLETVSHTLLATLHLVAHRPQVALYCNAANAVFTALARAAGVAVALNVDGLERKRRKWNFLGRAWYRLSERLSTLLPDAVVSDAATIAEYYRERYQKQTVFIPYGAEVGRLASANVLTELGLEPRRYFLYVSRMEPENNALMVREAFERVETEMKLVMVGDAPYAKDYIRQVRQTRDPRILFPGAIYGTGYHELTSHCFAYIHATEVGGTHPALIEAMGRGALTLYLRTEENDEVAGEAAIPFTTDLAEQMRRLLDLPEQERERWRALAMERVRRCYCWERVTDAYEHLFESLLVGRAR